MIGFLTGGRNDDSFEDGESLIVTAKVLEQISEMANSSWKIPTTEVSLTYKCVMWK